MLLCALSVLGSLTLYAQRQRLTAWRRPSPPSFTNAPTPTHVTTAKASGKVVLAPAQSGGSYNIAQGIIANGGGASAGGSYSNIGSVAQSNASSSTGGRYTLSGGFLGGGIGSQCPAITVNPPSLPPGQIGVPYNQQLSQAGGAGAVTWRVSAGALPNNLTLKAETGLLSGTPTASGTFNLTANVTDPSGCTGERAYALVINPCPTITIAPTTLPVGTAGTAYNQTLTAAGGASPYTFALSAGALPAGLSLSGGGTLSGTPTSAGTFNFTVKATDANGCAGTQSYALTINTGASVTLTSLSPGFAIVGSGGITLTVRGVNFASGMIVRWNGADRSTAFINSTELRATIPASDLTANGRANVTVFNPSTGATTAALSFLVANQLANVSAASYAGESLAPASIAAAFGARLAAATAVVTTVPLPLTLEGTTVTVRDNTGAERRALLFFVSPTQVNYQMPPDTAVGTALVYLSNRDGLLAAQTVQVAKVAPGLFTVNATGRGLPAAVLYRLRADNTLTTEAIVRFDAPSQRFVAVPIDFGAATDQLFLVLYGTGLRLRSSLGTVSCTLGGVSAGVEFAGSIERFVGLDQINLRLPRSLAGRGEVDLLLSAEGRAANVVKVTFK